MTPADLFSLLLNLSPYLRIAGFLAAGLFLHFYPGLPDSTNLFGLSLSPRVLGYLAFFVGLLLTGIEVHQVWRGDYSRSFSGHYRATFLYDEKGVLRAVTSLGPENLPKNVLLPTPDSRKWNEVRKEEFEYFDKLVEPESRVFDDMDSAKSYVELYLHAEKKSPQQHHYTIRGFGFVDDKAERAKSGTKTKVYTSLLRVDDKSKFEFANTFQLLRFFFRGSLVCLRVEQKYRLYDKVDAEPIFFYLLFKLKYSRKHGPWIKDTGLSYCSLKFPKNLIATSYTEDAAFMRIR